MEKPLALRQGELKESLAPLQYMSNVSLGEALIGNGAAGIS